MARKGHNRQRNTTETTIPVAPILKRASVRDIIMSDLEPYFRLTHGVIVELPLDGKEFRFYLDEIKDTIEYIDMIASFFKGQVSNGNIVGWNKSLETTTRGQDFVKVCVISK